LLLFINSNITLLQGYYTRDYNNIISKPYYGKSDWKGAIDYIKEDIESGDVLIIKPENYGAYLSYYFNIDLNITRLRAEAREQGINLKEITVNLPELNVNNITVRFILDRVDELGRVLDEYERVWILIKEGEGTKNVSQFLINKYGLGEAFHGKIHVYLIKPEFSKAVIIRNNVWDSWIKWKTILNLIGVSTEVYNDTVRIYDIDFSEHQLLVLPDFIRNIDNEEKVYLEQNIQNGLVVLFTGNSPFKLSNGQRDLGNVSKWFGAYSIKGMPTNERYKVLFEETALKVSNIIDVEKSYIFYKENVGGSTPTGCVIFSETISYSYREDDSVTVFSHEYGDGLTLFMGFKGYSFASQDSEILIEFIKDFLYYMLIKYR
jgi:hypothetical protein